MKRHHFAHVTDLHGGSKHFDRKALLAFLKIAKARGVDGIFDTGDQIDGVSEKLLASQRLFGVDDQQKEIVDVFAAADIRVPVWGISGNHDGYADDAVGTDVGATLARRMRDRGIRWTHLGQCVGRVVVHGAKIELWHGSGGAGDRNAVRRTLNRRAEGYAPGDSPHVLLIGHYHRYAQFVAYPEQVLCVSGGTFQRKRTQFANRIAKPWDIGGGILSWTTGRDGKAREFAYEFFPAKKTDAMGWS